MLNFAAMKTSKKHDSQVVEISSPGKYRLIREEKSSEDISLFLLEIIKSRVDDERGTISLSFLLKYYRFIINDWTQSELARRANIQKKQISDIERDKIAKPHTKTIKKLSKALGNDFERYALNVCDNT